MRLTRTTHNGATSYEGEDATYSARILKVRGGWSVMISRKGSGSFFRVLPGVVSTLAFAKSDLSDALRESAERH